MSYSVVVRLRGDPQAQVDLADIDGDDLLAYLSDLLSDHETTPWRDEDRHAYVLTAGVAADDADRGLDGFIRTGEWGVRAEGRHIRTDNRAYQREPEHVELQPFYFRGYFPRGQQAGIFVTQMIGNQGVKSLFWENRVRAAFAEDHPDHLLRFEPLYPMNVWKKYLEDERVSVKSVTLRRFELGSDVADLIGGGQGTIEDDAYVELQIKSKRRKRLPRVVAERLDKDDDRLLMADHLPWEEVKVTFDVEGRERTLTMGTDHLSQPRWDITDDLAFEDDAFTRATPDSLRSAASELIEELWERRG